MPWALFLCGVHVWIAAGYSLDGPFWWKQKIIFWLAGYGSAPQNCLNAKAMEYHKFVYAGHQHADHQLWAAGICGLLRKSVGRLILRSSSCSHAPFFCILPFPLSPYLQCYKGHAPSWCVVTCWIHQSSTSVELNASRRSEKWWLHWRARSRSMVDGEIFHVFRWMEKIADAEFEDVQQAKGPI